MPKWLAFGRLSVMVSRSVQALQAKGAEQRLRREFDHHARLIERTFRQNGISCFLDQDCADLVAKQVDPKTKLTLLH